MSLEDILYQCNEEDGFVEVCVIVRSPAVECPVSFSFDVRLFTVENTAGNYNISIKSKFI